MERCVWEKIRGDVQNKEEKKGNYSSDDVDEGRECQWPSSARLSSSV